MKTSEVLDRIAAETTGLGYRPDAVRRDYSFSDVWVGAGGTRTVPFVAFTQTPPSYRSAAFAVAPADSDEAQGVVEAHRSLGAPLFFVIEGHSISSWQVHARGAPRLLARFGIDRLAEIFSRHHDEWAPDVIHRAKSIGRVDKRYQLDFVDVGLIPAIEGEIHTKLDQLIREAVADVRQRTNNDTMRLLFRGVFRLLAAKILTDRGNARAKSWNAESVADVLTAMGEYYTLGNDTNVWPRGALSMLEPIWQAFRSGFNVANISADDLAYVYESTLVTPKARAEFGTHSTPRHVADYFLDRFRLWEFGAEPPMVYEPFAGAGVFLGSALRQMRDGLPHDWTDEQRHNLLIRHIGGAEIDPFACEVAKLSLILADYPNANGWAIEETNLFKDGALSARLVGQDVILCNPPFEAFTSKERVAYPDAHAIDGSKAVFALETALRAAPKMLGFVVPNTLLVDRRYLAQRRAVERLYREIELVSLPDGVFKVSQLDTALLIARDLRSPEEPQLVRSSAVYNADKKRFSVDRKPSHESERCRTTAAGDGVLWSPPLQHIWSALEEHPQLGTLVHGHWGLRWHGGQKGTPRVFDAPAAGRRSGFMDSSSIDQFVLTAPRYIDVRPEAIFAGGNLDWEAPKILANAGRLSRGYWRLAAAVDRDGHRASQQFMAFWPRGDRTKLDLDAIAALMNGPVINAFLTEHSFDKRFRITTLERAPVPPAIPQELGDLARRYAAAARQPETDPAALGRQLAEIDRLILKAYELTEEHERDLLAALEASERPLRHASSRRRSRQGRGARRSVIRQEDVLPLFRDRRVEEDVGEDLGPELSPSEAEAQLEAIARTLPIDEWAGLTMSAAELERSRSISPSDLDRWAAEGLIVAFADEADQLRFPVAQFEGSVPVVGLNSIVAAISDGRVAWLWLIQPHALLDRRRPLDALAAGDHALLHTLVARDFC